MSAGDWSRRGVIGAALIAGASSGSALAIGSQTASPPATIYRSEAWSFVWHSRRYRVSIAKPDIINPEAALELVGRKTIPIYVTDAAFNFGLVSSLTRMMQSGGELPPCLVIAIGYEDEEEADRLNARGFDLTPTDNPAYPGYVPKPGIRFGGAALFRQFIMEVLRPRVESTFDVDIPSSVLMGHSLGGLFTLDTMVQSPSSFGNYLATSPSLWFGDKIVLTQLKTKIDSGVSFPSRLAVLVGDREERIARESSHMTSNVLTIDRMIAEHRSQFPAAMVSVLPGATHSDILGPAYTKGLEFLLSPPRAAIGNLLDGGRQPQRLETSPVRWPVTNIVGCRLLTIGILTGNSTAMKTDIPEATMAPSATIPIPLSAAIRWRILLYLGALLMLLGLGSPYGGLIEIPISFFLKNKLHLAPNGVSQFRLLSSLPLYLSFLFGFVRDRWNPFGMRDRGFMVLFGAMSAGIYVFFAFFPVTHVTLLVAVALLTTSFLFISAAQQGLTSVLAQQHVMSGQISAVWNIFLSVPMLVAILVGGALSGQLEGRNADQAARILFLIGATLMILVTVYGSWKPKSVFDNVVMERERPSHAIDDVKRLVKHWPVYPALLIWLMWNFSPGTQTALQFHLQNTLHANDAQWGQWNAIVNVAFLPTYLLFARLCRRFPLKTLLLWGTIIGIPQFIPLLLIHAMAGAFVGAIFVGLMGGIANAAYTDLLIRSCPRGLQGTTLMMSGGLAYVATRFGDVLGTNLYERYGGFTGCVMATTFVYVLILPALLLVPRRLVSTADGHVMEPESCSESGRGDLQS